MRRLIAALIACVSTVLALGAAAYADSGGSIVTDEGGIEHAAYTDVSASDNGGGSRAKQRCTYTPLPMASDDKGLDVNGSSYGGDGTGTWYEKICDGNDYYGAVYVSRPNPADLLEQARRYLALPIPDPEMSPAGDQIVNLPTWLWLRGTWNPLSSTVSVLGASVTVQAVPVSAVWRMGDGTSVQCDGPGTPYNAKLSDAAQQPTSAHTYHRASATQPGLRYRASVTVHWHATWSATGFAGGGDLGVLDRTTTFDVRVGEVQALNTQVG